MQSMSMKYDLEFTPEADEQLENLEESKKKKAACKAVHKALSYMETNLKHPSLQTHSYSELKGVHGEKVYESYAQNKTPGAYRIFWHYGPRTRQITIVSILPHP